MNDRAAKASGKLSEDGSTLAVISRRIVGLLKEYYGKGPTRARTYHFGDLVVVLLKGGYTTLEKTLIESGRHRIVAEQRHAFQEAMRPRFKQVVEEEMRREVIAFMSATHHDPEINAELFVLASEEPEGRASGAAGAAADTTG